MDQPAPPDPAWPRYGSDPLPPYRFVPGRAPHPRRDPKGHSYGLPEPKPAPPDPARWRDCAPWLRSVDLYNQAYWWECHEELEGLWHAAGHRTTTGQFLQGLIQVAAANLKRFMGAEAVAVKLAAEGLERLAGIPSPYMGLDLSEFRRAAAAYFDGGRAAPAMIRLLP